MNKKLRLIFFILFAFVLKLNSFLSYNLFVKEGRKLLILGDNHNLSLNSLNYNHVHSLLECVTFFNSLDIDRSISFVYEFDREGMTYEQLKLKYLDMNSTFDEIVKFHELMHEGSNVKFVDFDSRNPNDKIIWSGYQFCKNIQFLFEHKPELLLNFSMLWQINCQRTPQELMQISLKQIFDQSIINLEFIIGEQEILRKKLEILLNKQSKLINYVQKLQRVDIALPIDEMLNIIISFRPELMQREIIVEFYLQLYNILEDYSDIFYIHKILQYHNESHDVILVVGIDHAVNIKRTLIEHGYEMIKEAAMISDEYLGKILSEFKVNPCLAETGFSSTPIKLDNNFLPNLLSAVQDFFQIDFPQQLIPEECLTKKYCHVCFKEQSDSQLKDCIFCDVAFCNTANCAQTHYDECKDLTYCAHCKKISKELKRCAGCKKVWYCNADCQRLHWKNHKVNCQQKK